MTTTRPVVPTATATRDGFDLARHPLSLLSLGDLGWIQIANFVLSGLLFLACAAGMRRVMVEGKGPSSWSARAMTPRWRSRPASSTGCCSMRVSGGGAGVLPVGPPVSAYQEAVESCHSPRVVTRGE